MTDSKDDIIFDHSSCPSLDQMAQYKAERLSGLEGQILEKHLLDCSICQEVFGHIEPRDLGMISTLTQAIDRRVDQRIAGGTSSRFDFNRYMLIAAALVGVLIIGGNLLTHTDIRIDPEVVIAEVEVGEVEDNIEGEKEMVRIEETEVQGGIEGVNSDSLEDSGAQVAAVSKDQGEENQKESGTVEESAGITVSDGQSTDPAMVERESETRKVFLMASVDLLIIETIEGDQSRGSTDKKIGKGKIKGIKGYSPEFEDEEGYPAYSGGDKKLREDIVQKINELHLSLGESGDVVIWITVSANGMVGSIEVDDKISVGLANRLKGALARLSPWVPGNVKIRYTLKLKLQ